MEWAIFGNPHNPSDITKEKEIKQNVHLKYFGVNKISVYRQNFFFLFFFPKVSAGVFSSHNVYFARN